MKENIFKVVTDEEYAKLSEEDQGKYLSDLMKWQTKSIEDLTIHLTKEGVDRKALEEKIKELENANIQAMKKSIETQGAEITKLMKEIDSKTSDKPITFKRSLLKELEARKDDIKLALDNKSGTITLEIKATQSSADIDAGADFAQMETGIGKLATRQTFMRSLFPSMNTTKEAVKYNDQETVVRDAKNVAGCAASTHNTKLTWKVRKIEMEKCRDFVHICQDMLEDFEWVSSEVRNLVDVDVQLQIDSQLLLGDNASPNLNSVDNVASTFAAGSYANTIQDAQIIDLLKVAASQIVDLGQNNKFMPNVILLNPIDFTQMELLKNANGNYLMPNWLTANGTTISGMRILRNQLVPAGEAYVMDSTKGTVINRKGITIEMSFENRENFEQELVTVKAYERLNFRVRNVDANAFMHIADIGAAIVAITAP